MSAPPFLRSLLPLIIGLAVGAFGAKLFLESLPAPEGSARERANQMELELKKARNRIAALEAEASAAGREPRSLLGKLASGETRKKVGEGARSIAEDIRLGRPVSVEDIFRASQPLMRDLAPLFDRMRLRSQQATIDRMTGELARKYALAPAQQELLKQWFARQAETSAKRWTELVGSENTRLVDLMRASSEGRPDDGLDAFMPAILSPEKLAQFKANRLSERARRLEQETDTKLQRLDNIVHLDESQRDRVFGILTRNSKDYDPQMVLEGAGGNIAAIPAGDPQAAILSVLRPDQRASFEAEKARRREAASKDMEAIGLALPPDWDMFADDFR